MTFTPRVAGGTDRDGLMADYIYKRTQGSHQDARRLVQGMAAGDDNMHRMVMLAGAGMKTEAVRGFLIAFDFMETTD